MASTTEERQDILTEPASYVTLFTCAHTDCRVVVDNAYAAMQHVACLGIHKRCASTKAPCLGCKVNFDHGIWLRTGPDGLMSTSDKEASLRDDFVCKHMHCAYISRSSRAANRHQAVHRHEMAAPIHRDHYRWFKNVCPACVAMPAEQKAQWEADLYSFTVRDGQIKRRLSSKEHKNRKGWIPPLGAVETNYSYLQMASEFARRWHTRLSQEKDNKKYHKKLAPSTPKKLATPPHACTGDDAQTQTPTRKRKRPQDEPQTTRKRPKSSLVLREAVKAAHLFVPCDQAVPFASFCDVRSAKAKPTKAHVFRYWSATQVFGLGRSARMGEDALFAPHTEASMLSFVASCG